VSSTTCAACGAVVGLVWFKGRSTLIDGPIDAEGEDLIMRKHTCRPSPPAGAVPAAASRPQARRPRGSR
jgi:hypothetical protein